MSSLLLLLAPWLSSYSDFWPPISFLVHGLTLHLCFALEFLVPHGATGALFHDLPPSSSLCSETLLSGLGPTPGSGHGVGLAGLCMSQQCEQPWHALSCPLISALYMDDTVSEFH